MREGYRQQAYNAFLQGGGGDTYKTFPKYMDYLGLLPEHDLKPPDAPPEGYKIGNKYMTTDELYVWADNVHKNLKTDTGDKPLL